MWRAEYTDGTVLEDGKPSEIDLSRLVRFVFGPVVVEWHDGMTDLKVGWKNYIAIPANGEQQRTRVPMFGFKENGGERWFSLTSETVLVSNHR